MQRRVFNLAAMQFAPQANRIGWSRFVVGVLLLVGTTVFPPTLAAQSSATAIEQSLPKMVKIFGAGGLKGLYAYSTGFFVSPEGHIATVWSHVLDRDVVTVVLDDGRKFFAEVVGAEPSLDLAVLKVRAEGVSFPFFDLEQAGPVGSGTRVLGLSNMFKVATGDEPVSVIHGVVAAVTELPKRRGAFHSTYEGQVYVVDAITNNAGADGGALVTYDGQLVGMIGKQLRDARLNSWVNYAMPIDQLRESITEIITGKFKSSAEKEEPTDEGPLNYRPADFGMVLIPDVISRTPAYIDEVLPNSAAAQAGMRTDDLVLFVNDQLVQSCGDLKQQLGKLEAGDSLHLVVRRGSGLVTFELDVPERK